MMVYSEAIIPNKKTLAEQTYEILYNGIISGRFKPGDVLTEVQLAEQLHISRTPVREALKRLKEMGLLVGSSYTRMTVKEITREEINEVMHIRTLLEMYTIEAAVTACTDKDIQVLEGILEKTRNALEQNNYSELFAYNSQFHEYLTQISGKEVALQLLNTLRTRVAHYRVIGRPSGMHWRNYEGHCRMVEHLRNRDKQKLVAEVLKHTEESRTSTLAGLERSESNR